MGKEGDSVLTGRLQDCSLEMLEEGPRKPGKRGSGQRRMRD